MSQFSKVFKQTFFGHVSSQHFLVAEHFCQSLQKVIHYDQRSLSSYVLAFYWLTFLYQSLLFLHHDKKGPSAQMSEQQKKKQFLFETLTSCFSEERLPDECELMTHSECCNIDNQCQHRTVDRVEEMPYKINWLCSDNMWLWEPLEMVPREDNNVEKIGKLGF